MPIPRDILPTIYELRIACRQAGDVTESQFTRDRSTSAATGRALYCHLLRDIYGLSIAEVSEACGVDRTTVGRYLAEIDERIRARDTFTLSLIDEAEKFAAALVHLRLGPVPWRKETPCPNTDPCSTQASGPVPTTTSARTVG